jgi:hypothetical protein
MDPVGVRQPIPAAGHALARLKDGRIERYPNSESRNRGTAPLQPIAVAMERRNYECT